jgi:hypothetical protein
MPITSRGILPLNDAPDIQVPMVARPDTTM